MLSEQVSRTNVLHTMLSEQVSRANEAHTKLSEQISRANVMHTVSSEQTIRENIEAIKLDSQLHAPRQDLFEFSSYPTRQKLFYSALFGKLAPYMPALITDPGLEYQFFEYISVSGWLQGILPTESMTVFGYFANILVVENYQLTQLNPSLSFHTLDKVDHVCLLHPAQALYFLYRDGYMDMLAQSVKQTLRLVAMLPVTSIVPMWGRHFSPKLNATVPYRRLEVGRVARLILWNTTEESIHNVALKGICNSFGEGELLIHLTNPNKTLTFSSAEWFFNIDLPPGQTDIYFEYKLSASSTRNYVEFYQVDLSTDSLTISDEAMMSEDYQGTAILNSEQELRSRFHAAGFMDVVCHYYLLQQFIQSSGISRLNIQTLQATPLTEVLPPPRLSAQRCLQPVLAIGYRGCYQPFIAS